LLAGGIGCRGIDVRVDCIALPLPGGIISPTTRQNSKTLRSHPLPSRQPDLIRCFELNEAFMAETSCQIEEAVQS
jgi:hypothetical protein